MKTSNRKNSRTICRELIIKNESGLHARPAAKFVRLANRFSSDISVEFNGEIVNGKSIMGLMTLGANQGAILKLTILGPDASTLFAELQELFDNSFE